MWTNSFNMLQLFLIFLLLPGTIIGQSGQEWDEGTFGRRLDNGDLNLRTLDRNGKSLLNTFPFNARHDGDHHHDDEHHHVHENNNGDDGNRLARQGSHDDVPLDIGSIAAAGERCIDKVIMVQETEYDDVIECKHSYSERCHTTYTTDYQPQQEEECDENFKKRCFIEYKNIAFDEKVKFCVTPLVKNCNIPGPIECKTEYRSECSTRYHEHEVEDDVVDCQDEAEKKCEQITQGYTTEEKCTTWPTKRCSLAKQKVKKYTPETECKKVPFELCGPAGCPVEPGPEECFDKTETLVQEVPEENCSLEPQQECKFVTKLVPLLKPAENCIDIPKEVCSRSRKNPRKISKPVIKKWCYTPTKESGLLPPPPPRTTTPRPTRPSPPPTRPPTTTTRPTTLPTTRPTTPPPPPTRRPFGGFDSGNSNQGSRAPPNRTTERPVTSTCAKNLPANYCESRRANGRCDFECNIPECSYDGGDCAPPPTTRAPSKEYLPPRRGY